MDLDIDDMIKDDEEHRNRENRSNSSADKPIESMTPDTEESNGGKEDSDSGTGKVPIGRVEHFFSKLNVAAIKLTGDLKVGDMIEIKSDEGLLKMRVLGMQINKEEVGDATAGDSIGIKVDQPVKQGSLVYLMS